MKIQGWSSIYQELTFTRCSSYDQFILSNFRLENFDNGQFFFMPQVWSFTICGSDTVTCKMFILQDVPQLMVNFSVR